MRRFIKSTIILLTLFTGCTSPENKAMNDLIGLAEYVEAEHETLTVEDWKGIAQTLDELENEMSQYHYTDAELKEIGRQKGRIVGYLTKWGAKTAEDEISNVTKQLEGAIEGFQDAFDETVDDRNSSE